MVATNLKTIHYSDSGYPGLEVNVSQFHPNMAIHIAMPESVRQATGSVRVESEKLLDGVWLLSGGSHNSVAVEFAAELHRPTAAVLEQGWRLEVSRDGLCQAVQRM